MTTQSKIKSISKISYNGKEWPVLVTIECLETLESEYPDLSLSEILGSQKIKTVVTMLCEAVKAGLRADVSRRSEADGITAETARLMLNNDLTIHGNIIRTYGEAFNKLYSITSAVEGNLQATEEVAK